VDRSGYRAWNLERGGSAHALINVHANKFLVNMEHMRDNSNTGRNVPNPGELNVYIYHPEQRSQWGDHFMPDGTVFPYSSQPGNFGPDFVPRASFIPELERWYCYEFMVKTNTPGSRDGRLAGWVDGKLAFDFPNIRLRDVADLKIDQFDLQFHINGNPTSEATKYYDNVVAATSYLGRYRRARPLRRPALPLPPPPCA